ncbi:hypothetical protein HDV00_007186 [Rhizophlyctis rosea]|nr:hypothetical protein HDV00_007186 [Rhizophlyctis rosea]
MVHTNEEAKRWFDDEYIKWNERAGMRGPLTHILGSEEHGINQTCGPDLCQLFDKTLDSAVTPIDNFAIRHAAESFVHRYKTNAALIKHNHLLVHLGGELPYPGAIQVNETITLFENYERIFEYINQRTSESGVAVKWSTLSEYFDEVEEWERHVQESNGSGGGLKSYGGDLAHPLDDDDHYWTGYKKDNWYETHASKLPTLDLHELLMSLYILIDTPNSHPSYHMKELARSQRSCRDVIDENESSSWICGGVFSQIIDTLMSRIVSPHQSFSQISSNAVYVGRDESKVLGVWNSGDVERVEVVQFAVLTRMGEGWVGAVDVEVWDGEGERVVVQVIPEFGNDGKVQEDRVGVVFEARVPPIGMAFYGFRVVEMAGKGQSTVTLWKEWDWKRYVPGLDDALTLNGGAVMKKNLHRDKMPVLSNPAYDLHFTQSGWPKTLTVKPSIPPATSTTIPFSLEPRIYNTTNMNPKIFKPVHPPTRETFYPPACKISKVWQITGQILNRVVVHYTNCPIPTVTYTLHKSDNLDLDIQHAVNMDNTYKSTQLVWELEVPTSEEDTEILTDVNASPFFVPHTDVPYPKERIGKAFHPFTSLAIIPISPPSDTPPPNAHLLLRNMGIPSHIAHFHNRTQWMIEKVPDDKIYPGRRGWRHFRMRIEGGEDAAKGAKSWRKEYWDSTKPLHLFNGWHTKDHVPTPRAVSFWKGRCQRQSPSTNHEHDESESVHLISLRPRTISTGDAEGEPPIEVEMVLESSSPNVNWTRVVYESNKLPKWPGWEVREVVGLDRRKETLARGGLTMTMVVLRRAEKEDRVSVGDFEYGFGEGQGLRDGGSKLGGVGGRSDGSVEGQVKVKDVPDRDEL